MGLMHGLQVNRPRLPEPLRLHTSSGQLLRTTSFIRATSVASASSVSEIGEEKFQKDRDTLLACVCFYPCYLFGLSFLASQTRPVKSPASPERDDATYSGEESDNEDLFDPSDSDGDWSDCVGGE
jgi:hypothetical protein